MKLKYTFDDVNMGDEIVSVPIGKGADQIHGIVKMNKSGQEIMNLLKEDTNVEKIIDVLSAKYDNDKEELKSHVLQIVDVLRNAGILEE